MLGNFLHKITGSIATQLVALGIGFIGSIILSRELGADGRGVVSWIMSLHIIGAAISQLGLANVNRRFASEYAEKPYLLAWLTICICLLAASIMIPLIVLLAWNNNITSSYPLAFAIGMLGMPILSIGDTLNALQIGLHKSKSFNLSNVMQKSTTVAIYLVCAFLSVLSPLTAMLALMIGACTKLAIALRSIGSLPYISAQEWQAVYNHIKQFMRFSSASSLANLAVSHGIITLLGVFSQPTQIGLFATAYVLIEATLIIPRITSMYAVPGIVRCEKRREKIRLALFALMIVAAIMGILNTALYACASWLIPLLFGQDFIAAIPTFSYLLLGSFIYSLYIILQAWLQAESESHIITLPPIISATMILIGANMLFTEMGALGGAYTWIIANSIGALATSSFIVVHYRSKKPAAEKPVSEVASESAIL
jgi:O-antigen/teichoic acid export membrane protein